MRAWPLGLKFPTNKGHLNPSGLNEINEASHLNGGVKTHESLGGRRPWPVRDLASWISRMEHLHTRPLVSLEQCAACLMSLERR